MPALRARGMTLVELMVALVTGMGVMLVASRLLLLVGSAYAVQAEQAAVDDAGRFALDIVARALRQSGQVELAAVGEGSSADVLPARVTGLDAHSLAHGAPALDAPLPDAVNGSDVLAVRFPGAGAGASGDGSVLSCAGFSVGAREEGWSIFYVARSAQGDGELRCKYRGANGWSSDAVVAGVDGFQVLYGIDTDTPRDGVPNRYVNADAIRQLDAAAPVVGGWWRRVVSVRIGLLLHGAHATRDGGARRYDLLGPAYAAGGGADDPGSSLSEAELPADQRRRERRLFGTTVALPSHAP